jgi:hypothetical protein
MAEGASDELKTQPPSQPRASVEAVEADIVHTRERLSLTLAGLNAEVRALLDPNTPVTLASGGTRDAAHKIAVGLRTMRQIRALARVRTFGPLGVVAGLGVFLFRSGLTRRLWNQKRRQLDRTPSRTAAD